MAGKSILGRDPNLTAEEMQKSLLLYIEGRTIEQIRQVVASQYDLPADKGITAKRMKMNIDAALKIWKETYYGEADAVLSRELARLDKLEETYWKAWESSLTGETTVDEIELEDSGRKVMGETFRSVSEIRSKTKKKNGNPDFLAGVERVILIRYKLLGIGNSRTVNINWRSEVARQGLNPDEVLDNVVQQIIDASEKNGNAIPMLEGGEDKNDR